MTRFDFPAFNLSDSDAPTGALPSGLRTTGVPPRGAPAPQRAAGADFGCPAARRLPSRAARQRPRRASENTSLPPLVPEHRPAATREPTLPRSARRPAAAPGSERERAAQKDVAAGAARAAPGDTIEVEPGDTLYGISKRYGVSLADLIEANGLHHGASLKPGQQLLLPAGALARQARREARGKPAIALVPVAKAPVAIGAPPTPIL